MKSKRLGMLNKSADAEQNVENSSTRLKKLMNKHQMAYTWLNFFVLMVMFVGVAFMIFGLTHTNYLRDVEKLIVDQAKELSVKAPLQEFNQDLPVDLSVIYYNPEREMIDNYGNGTNIAGVMKDLGMLDKSYKATINQKDFKIYTTAMADGNYVKVAVCIDMYEHMFNKVSIASIIFMSIGAIGLFFVSIILAYAQIKPYQKALDSSLTFTSNVSHELNTPLSILKANIETMLSSDSNSIFSSELVTCLSETDRLKRLTSQLLLLSRSDNNRLVYIFKPYNILKTIKNIIEPYVMMAEDQSKELNLYTSNNLDNEYMIDRDLFYQIFIALLDNAIKYTDTGEKISVHIKILRNKFFLTVSDNGKGVENSELEKIFVRFYRSENSRTTSGTGLGLPIVHAIVSSLGGKIVANNLSPTGFAVTVTFPIKAVGEA